MPLSNRFIRRDHLVGVAPMRLETLLDEAQTAMHSRQTGSMPQGGRGDESRSAYEAGFAAGAKSVAARYDAERARDRCLIAAIDREIARIDDDFASNLLKLAADISEQVTRTQIKVHPETVIAVVREALEALRDDASAMRLLLNPEDAKLVEGSLAADLTRRHCQVLPDASLARGDCRIETGLCEIDATVAARWRRALQPLGLSHDWIE